MTPAVFLASLLVLHPVVEDATPLRLVATGTEDAAVTWTLDGQVVAVTADGEAVRIQAAAGMHTVEAETDHDGPWRMLVRPEPNVTGVTYVDAWTAVHTPAARPAAADTGPTRFDPVPLALGALGLLLLVVPRRRPKRP